MLSRVLHLLIGAYYGQLLASFHDSYLTGQLCGTRSIFGPYQSLEDAWGRATIRYVTSSNGTVAWHETQSSKHTQSSKPNPNRARLPLSACGYGPLNFTFMEYDCCTAAKSDTHEISRANEWNGTVYGGLNPFKGLGFEVDIKDPNSLVAPSRRQVHDRIQALKEVWPLGEETLEDSELDNEETRLTGLSRSQLQHIWVKLDEMQDHIDALLKDKQHRGAIEDNDFQEWFNGWRRKLKGQHVDAIE